jgi:prevent-host-death family protein
MRTIGIKALKNNLSAYIRAVEAGETVAVTDRGKVVAQLVPAHAPSKPTTDEDRIAQLVREGHLTPARRQWTGPPPRIGHVPFDELMRQLDADREDR